MWRHKLHIKSQWLHLDRFCMDIYLQTTVTSISPKQRRKCKRQVDFYTTIGRDRFHWAATPLKPYKVGNICYMTYRYSVLYFLNLSLKDFFPQKTAIFVKISKSETVIVSCFNVSRMPNRHTSQTKIEDIVHCNNVRTDRSPPRFMCIVLHQFDKLNDKHTFTTN
mgnify:CR=1 FL=1